MTSAFRLSVVILSASLLSACGGDSKEGKPGPGPATTLALSGVPTAATAGVAALVTATVSDASGKVATGYRGTVHLASTDPGAQLPADLAFTEADAGERTFAVVWRTAGAGDLTAADVSDASLTVTVATSVAAADAVRLAFADAPSGATAGAILAPAVRVSVLDAFGNLVTSGTPSVSLELQGGSPEALLSGGGVNVASSGVAEFAAASVDRAGAGYRLAAEAPGLLGATSAPFSVVPADPDASASSVSALPGSLPAGGTASLTATVRDVFGNPIPGVTVTFQATGADSTLSQPAAVTDAAGVAAGSLSSTAAGSKTVAAQAGSLPLAPQPVVTFAATHVDQARSTAVAAPASVVADGATPSTITVTLLDAFGNPVPGQWATLSSSRGAADALSSSLETSDASGTASFTLQSAAAGASTLTVVVQSVATPVSLSVPVTFVAGPVSASASTVVSSPSTVSADGSSPATVTVTLLDAAGNPVPGKDVALASDRGIDDTVTPASAISDAAGAVAFTVSSTKFGAATFTAADTSDGLALAQTARVAFVGTVSPSRSTVVPSPAPVLADGAASSAITVRVVDAFGNPVAGEDVALASDRGATDTISPASGTTDAAGQVAFTVTSRRFGVSTLTATLTAYGVTLTQTPTVTFLSYLVFATQPAATATSGSAFDPLVTVAARDAEGNTDAAFASDVTLAVGANPSGGVLHGTLTVAPVAGVATYPDAFVDKAGSGYTLVATTAAAGVPPVTSSLFLVAPGSPAALAFAVQPSNSGAGIHPMIPVAVQDAWGNTTTATGVEVSLALGANPGGATLGGTLTAASVLGIATFEGLTVSATGAGYTLVASDPLGVLASATSLPFDVEAPIYVGDGTPASCTEATLAAALATGGHIHFACGPDPVTITLTSTKTIGADVGLDGEGRVTLSGGSAVQLFSVAAGRTFALENLTITAGASGGNGGAIYSAGTLLVSDCTLSSSVAGRSDAYYATAANGGAIFSDGGTLLVSGTTFSGNRTGGDWNAYGTYCNGGAIFGAGGTIIVADSTFSGNATGSSWAHESTIGNGGAIFHAGGSLRVTGCTFSGNTASASRPYAGTAGTGGAIHHAGGALLVSGTTFSGNSASSYDSNSSTAGTGGAIDHAGGTALVTGSTFSANGANGDWSHSSTSAGGGAIFSAAGVLVATNSTFTGNGASVGWSFYSTAGCGGAVFNAGSRLELVNVTLAGNTVGGGYCYSSTCAVAGAIYGGATLTNTIVARGAAGANCSGAFVDGGHDLDSDGTCGVGPATDPLLDAAGLADNGGPTRTIALQETSPAIDAADGGVCAAEPVMGVDQRGYQRPGTGASACSIGAFEYDSPGPP